jgi:hypothetical protein
VGFAMHELRFAARVGIAALLVLTLAAPSTRAEGDLDLTRIFWCKDGHNGGQTAAQCAESRELILLNCTVCHSFVRIVRAQKTEVEWNATFSAHRYRLANATAEQFAMIRQYLIAHFNPGNPRPELPPALEQLIAEEGL